MPEVALKMIYCFSKEAIGLFYDPDPQLELTVRKIEGVHWSQRYKCWFLPLSKASYNQIFRALGPLAHIDPALLKAYLNKRKQVTATFVQKAKGSRPPVTTTAWSLSSENLNALQLFVQLLKLKAYSKSTIQTYRGEFLQLLQVLKKRPVNQLTPEELKRYMVYAMEKQGISENTAHSRLNALKFYFEQVLGKERFFWEIPRPKKAYQLPKVLNERELERMFAAVKNIKHKALMFTAYSAGLRVSEVVHLKLSDIDSTRMQIRVEQAKGKKDRYVGLSVLLLEVLRAYLRLWKPRPQTFLFEGDRPSEPYGPRSAQLIFHHARQRAGILKTVSFHALRHSFATHLLEKGVDIRYIKELLGHFNIKTTERYLHVKRQDLVVLVNPLDELYKGKSWNF